MGLTVLNRYPILAILAFLAYIIQEKVRGIRRLGADKVEK